MFYNYKDNVLSVSRLELDIKRTLESGQIFRYDALDNSSYVLYSKDSYVLLEQRDDESLIYPISKDDLAVWVHYFDLDISYDDIMQRLIEKDEQLRTAYVGNEGIRILNQDLFEIIISFIISQNNNIPRIRKIIDTLCRTYGTEFRNETLSYFGFPSREQLSKATLEDLKKAGLGYRAEYITESCKTLTDDFLSRLMDTNNKSSYDDLLSMYGVGPKVANCITLFGLHKLDSFPIDTWIKKVLHVMYGVDNNKDISEVVSSFGKYAGIAQQYLFYYARNNQELFR